VPGPNGDLAGGGFSMMMMMMIGWLVIATALFLLRPASLRRQLNEKPSGMVGALHSCCVSYSYHIHLTSHTPVRHLIYNLFHHTTHFSRSFLS